MSPVQDSPPMEAELERVKYAGFWRRLAAMLIDGVILVLALLASLLLVKLLAAAYAKPALLGFEIVATWLYFSLMESSSLRATLGKLAIGIRVTDLAGNRVSFLRATVRHYSKFLSAAILFAGFINAASTEKKQGLHDAIAGCLVVCRRKAPQR